jgi:hypothetical protein
MKQKILFIAICLFLSVTNQTKGQSPVLPPDVVFPDNIVDAECYVLPPANEWKIQEVTNNLGSIFSTLHTTLIGDIDDDDNPEILLVGRPSSTELKLHIVDGASLSLKKSFNLDNSYDGVNPLAAIGKIQWTSGEYKNVIFTLSSISKRLYAYDINGTKLWTSDADFCSVAGMGATIQLIDLDGDGWAEIVVGNKVFAAESGKLLCQAGSYSGYIHGWSTSALLIQSMAGDILNNGKQQICIGNTIYDVTITSRAGTSGNTMSQVKTFTPQVWNGSANETVSTSDGAVQLVDLDLDGNLDIVVSTVVRNETTPTNSVFYMYVYSYAKNKIIASKKTSRVYKRSVPFIGDIDGDGYPEIVLVHGGTSNNAADTNDYITALKYDSSSTSGELSVFWRLYHTDTSGVTGITLFDFNQDGISELVYRDETLLRIINGSGIHHQTGLAAAPYNLASFACTSATAYEYPVVADIDNSGEAKIIVVGETSKAFPTVGPLRVFKAGSGTVWAPARKVWNQYSYNAVNVNENLTIPRRQMNPATRFAGNNGILGDGDDVRPFNNFLQQQTILNPDGEPLWLAPNGQIVGTPILSYNKSLDEMTVTLNVHNAGDVAFRSPFKITAYKDNVGGSQKYTYTHNSVIDVGQTETITFSISSFSSWITYNFIVIKINDNGNGNNDQAVCDDSLNQYRYYGVLPTAQEVCLGKAEAITCSFTLSSADTYQWQSSKDNIVWADISGASYRSAKRDSLLPGSSNKRYCNRNSQ